MAGPEVEARLVQAVKEYAEYIRSAQREGEAPAAGLSGKDLTATEAMLVIDALLEAAALEVFEVHLWRATKWNHV